MKKVLVGMSGGVDSSVVAALLIEQGYQVSGVFIEAYNELGCRTDQDKKDALQVALKLGIPFEVLDYRSEYKAKVVQYFVDEYRAGRTPNPDIVCNREVKFGLLYDYAMQKGFDYLATGHYARIVHITEHKTRNTYLLQRPRDLSKDQTYFLWQVTRDKLAHVLFPLGDLLKSEVREKARELGLPNAKKPDSMGVCMLGELNITEFLQKSLGEQEGEIRMGESRVGVHKGIWFYTIGQKVGGESCKLQVASLKKIGVDTTNLPALYVVGKNVKKNELVIGKREECYVDKFKITNSSILQSGQKLRVRIRNLGELIVVIQCQDNTVTLEQPVFAPAPGQSAVFYTSSGVVAGGGIIV